MKTQSKTKIKLLKSYHDACKDFDEAKERKEGLREQLLHQLKKAKSITGGGYNAWIEKSSRTVIDKASLVSDQGEDFVKEYERKTRYNKVKIKKVA